MYISTSVVILQCGKIGKLYLAACQCVCGKHQVITCPFFFKYDFNFLEIIYMKIKNWEVRFKSQSPKC